MAAVAEIGGAEHQPLAHLRNIGAVAQMLEVPGAVDGVAIEHGADDLLVAQDDALVDAAGGVLQHDLFLVRARREIAGREQVDAGDLQLGRGDRAVIGGEALHGEVVGADLGLLEQRRHEAVDLAAMLHAFADRVDAPVEGLHGVGDDDAALAMEARLARQLDIGADADRHHDEIGGKLRAVREAHARDAVLAEDRLGLRRHLEHHAALFQRLAQQSAGDRSSWRSISVSSRCTTVTFMPRFIRPLAASRPSRPPPITTALLVAGRGLEHVVDVVDVAEGDDARQILARQRQHDRVRAGGDQQPVVGHPRAVGGDDLAVRDRSSRSSRPCAA